MLFFVGFTSVGDAFTEEEDARLGHGIVLLVIFTEGESHYF